MAGSALLQRAPAHAEETAASLSGSAPPVAPPQLDFEQVYATHFDFIWRSVRGLGVHPAFVDDATQEVFLIVHRKLAGLEAPEALRSWLFGIARRVCRDHRRSAKRRGPQLELDLAREISHAADPQEHAASREHLELVEAYASQLDEDRRALFFLVLIEGMQIADAAHTLGLNVNTAYSRVRVLRRELAERLGVTDASQDGRGSDV